MLYSKIEFVLDLFSMSLCYSVLSSLSGRRRRRSATSAVERRSAARAALTAAKTVARVAVAGANRAVSSTIPGRD